MSDYKVTAIKKAVGIALGLLSASLLAKYLGPALRGEYAVLMNGAAILVVLLNFGVSSAYQAARRQNGVGEAPRYIGHSATVSAGVLAAAVMSAAFVESVIALMLVISAVSLFRMQIQSIGLVENLKGSAYSANSGSLLELLSIGVLWIFAPAALGLAVGALIVKECAIAATSLHVVAHSYKKSSSNLSKVLFWKQVRASAFFRQRVSLTESWPAFLITLFILLNYKLDIIILRYLGVDSFDIGVFAVGVLIGEYLWIFSDIFKEVQISRSAKGDGVAGVASANRMALFVTGCVYIGFLAIGWWLVPMFFGSEYSSSFDVAAYMLIGNIFIVPCKIIGVHYLSTRRLKNYVVISMIAMAINVVCNFVLVPTHGIYGAIAASIVSYSFMGCALIIDFRSTSKLRFFEIIFITLDEIKIMARIAGKRVRLRRSDV